METTSQGAIESEVAPASRRETYLFVSQAAHFLGVSTGTLRNWDREGKLKAERNPVNRYRMYRRSELERLLAERRAAVRDARSLPIRTPEQPRPGPH